MNNIVNCSPQSLKVNCWVDSIFTLFWVRPWRQYILRNVSVLCQWSSIIDICNNWMGDPVQAPLMVILQISHHMGWIHIIHLSIPCDGMMGRSISFNIRRMKSRGQIYKRSNQVTSFLTKMAHSETCVLTIVLFSRLSLAWMMLLIMIVRNSVSSNSYFNSCNHLSPRNCKG